MPESDTMNSSPLLVGTTIRAPGSPRTAPEAAWGLLGAAGLAFTFVAVTDLLLPLLPLRIGDGRWEFDAVTAVLQGVPLLLVGVILGYAAAYARERAGGLRLWSAFALLVAALLTVALTTYLLRVPSVLATADSSAVRFEFAKGIVKTVCQGIAYPIAFCWLGIRGWMQAGQT
jgi:hypothetical protein